MSKLHLLPKRGILQFIYILTLIFGVVAVSVSVTEASNSFDFLNLFPDDEVEEEVNTESEAQQSDEVANEPIDLPYPPSQPDSDPNSQFAPRRGIGLQPSNLSTEIEYDEQTGTYRMYEKTGAFQTSTPYSMSQDEYNDYSSRKVRNDYWHARAKESRADGSNRDNSPLLELGGEAFDKVFGSNAIDVTPQGTAELTFGVKYNKSNNPSLTRKQQSNTSFDFDNKIQMSVTGKVGDKVSLTVKYDTEAQFEFDNEMKLEYEGDEDEIIKKIEAGNVSFPVDNTLITGSQSLFGFRTDLQFGKLFVSGVFSRQEGEFSTIEVDGGAQTNEFEVRCDEYEKDKHFFLSHYFRENYEDAFYYLPNINNGISIEKVEVWITQNSSGSENTRDLLALADLGEASPAKSVPTRNDATQLYSKVKRLIAGKNINEVATAMKGAGYSEYQDYERIEKAVKLNTNQYTINTQLGYISLNSTIANDKVLAISYEYTKGQNIYRVGEFAADIKDSSSVLIVKLLKPRGVKPKYSTWDLMMKNVYSIRGFEISKDDFKLDIYYEDDKTGTPITYFPEGSLQGRPLLNLMNLDNINRNDQPYSDGIYDFVPGLTINTKKGYVIFPVLEPFGQTLADSIGDKDLIRKYAYTELYDSTKIVAKSYTSKNKYLIKGSYKSSYSSEISLNTTSVEEGSVTVTAGGRTLVEDVDYTVDYNMGVVRILDSGLLASGTPIKVSLESNPLINTKTKTLWGTRLDYRFNDKANLGFTLLRLSEVPSSQKVGFDDFPISNTIWGLHGTYSNEVPFLTKVVDKIPLIQTKEKSNITLRGEFAQLVPGHSKYMDDAVEIDYFEDNERKISLREPTAWVLASVPQEQKRRFPEGNLVNNVMSGYNRAHVSWYNINTTFYERNSPVSKAEQSNHYARPVYEQDLFENSESDQTIITPMSILNLAYYPTERGAYNYDVKGVPGISAGLDPATGKLKDPASRWGGIMRAISTDDFEENNIEYIEFWLMDPFIYDTDNKHKGGDLYINIGDISEDVLRDNYKQAENTLSDNPTDYYETSWGHITKYEPQSSGFDNNSNRSVQDVGLDGLNDESEQVFFRKYLAELRSYVSPSVYEEFEKDPSKDNYFSYLDSRGENNLGIVARYKYIRQTDGNSPSGSSEGGGTQIPDNEDLNKDNTMNTSEAYFQYHVSIRKDDFVVGRNFCVDKVTEHVEEMPNGDRGATAEWYQFKIPISTTEKERFGDIDDFSKISYMRMFLSGFEDSVVLRFGSFGLTSSKWRKYDEPLYEAGEYDIFNDSEFDISTVNLEENGGRYPVNYILPPGVDREIDPMNTLLTQMNEASLELTVKNLEDGNSKAIYKNINKDFRSFGRLQMFAHAESLIDDDLENDDLHAFIRMGSDFTDNYYEYEIPLKVTEHRQEGIEYSSNRVEDRLIVWPAENKFDIDFKVLTELKRKRDREIIDGNDIETTASYSSFDENFPQNTVTIKGRPSLGNVRVMMLGIRNKKAKQSRQGDDGESKSAIIWFNELRLTEFNEDGGWAANASARIDLADFATVSLDGQMSRAGFGSIDQKTFDRSMEDVYQYGVATNVSLNKFFPEKLGLSLPFYWDRSVMLVDPKYDPTNTDILVSQTLDDMNTSAQKDSVLDIIRERTERTSFNFTNVRINPKDAKKHILSISNFTASYAFTKYHFQDINTKYEDEFTHKASFNYNYTFKAKNYQPFSSINSKQLQIIKDFNFYLLPQQIGMNNIWEKEYAESQVRNLSNNYELPKTYSKQFTWERDYVFKYYFSKNLKFDYSASNMALIDEPEGLIDKSDDVLYDEYKTAVWNSFWRFGETSEFNQQINVTYKLPINKILPLNWISSDYKYLGTYTWIEQAEQREAPFGETNIDFGNEIKNSNTQSIDFRFNFRTLYTKSKYFSNLEKQMRRGSSNQKKTETVKFTQEGQRMQAGKPIEISHKLRTKDVKVSAIASNGRVVPGSTEVVSDSKVVFTPSENFDNVKIIVSGKREIQTSVFKKIVDGGAKTLMMFKSATINYSENNGSYVPGYRYRTQYFGQSDPFSSSARPGWLYVSGYVPEDLEERIYNEAWLTSDTRMSTNYTLAHSTTLKTQIQLEPIKSMRITLDTDRKYSENMSKYLLGDPAYNDANARTMGTFSISCNTLSTAFDSEEAYKTFRDNRLIIANRLANKYGENYEVDPQTGFPIIYDETSQDVLIPAFVSAYTGQSPEDVDVDNYFHSQFDSFKSFLKSLNWKASYSGLSKIKPLTKYFKSVTINHKYSSTYTIGNYETFNAERVWDDMYENISSYEAQIMPMYDVASVSISEKFSPLIGVDMKWQSSFTSKFEVKRSRTVSLSFVNTEISENSGFEYVFGIGYIFKDFALKIKTQGTSKTFQNDLTVRCDFSVRENETIRRNVIEDYTQRISGTKIYSLKSSAEYMLTDRFTVRLYFDLTNNRPLVNGYNNTAISGGINLRFSLM